MSDQSIKNDFNNNSLADYMEPFKTVEARQKALEVHTNSKEMYAQAVEYFQKVVDKNRQKASNDFPTVNSKENEKRRQNVVKAHTKFQVRKDKIDQAKKNQIERIKQKQTRDLARQQMGGRSLSEEFQRRR